MAANTCTILKEALAIPGKNPKLISSLFLVSSLVNFLFSYANQLHAHSIPAGLAPAGSIRSAIAMELVLSIVFAAVSSVLLAIDIYALAMTHAGKHLTLRELLRDAKPAVRRSVATELLVFYPVFTVYDLALTALVILWGRVAGPQILLRGLIVAAGVAGLVLGYWTVVMCAVVWTLTAVEERWGVAAVKRAAVVARGRMRTAVVIMVTTNAVSILAALAQYVLTKIVAGEMGVWGEVGVRAVYYMAAEAIQFVLRGAFAVFYYEWKSRGGGVPAKTMVEKGGFYAKLLSADVV